MRYRDIVEGTRAIKVIDLPLVNVPCSLLPDIPELAEQRQKDALAAAKKGGPEVPSSIKVGLRVLTGDEFLEIEELARKMTESRGAKAVDGDVIYHLAQSVFTVALACVDPDSDPADPTPLFGEKGKPETAAKQLLASPHIGRDGIVYLAEQHEHWQDMCNPQALKVSADRLWQLVGEVAASNDASPFLLLRPGMRVSFTRFMAALLVSLRADKFFSGSSLSDIASTNQLDLQSSPSSEPAAEGT